LAATSAHGRMEQQWRVSVRLDSARAVLLKKLSTETGCDPSELIRRSLDHYAASRSPKRTNQRPEMKVPNAALRQVMLAGIQGPKVASAVPPELRLTTIVKVAPSAPSTPTDPTPALPTRIAELVTQARGFGSQLKRIRREQFQRAFVASAVAAESAENPQDSEVYADMLRLGRRYRWLE
jgi:hypothetical protein